MRHCFLLLTVSLALQSVPAFGAEDILEAKKENAPALLPGIADPSMLLDGAEPEEVPPVAPKIEAPAKAVKVEPKKIPVTPVAKAPAVVAPVLVAPVVSAPVVPAPAVSSPQVDLAESGIPGKPLPIAAEAATPVIKEKLDKLGNSPLPEVPQDAEVAVILMNARFYPSRLRLKEGQPTKLIFTSLNPKPAALIVEQLQVQRWIAGEGGIAITEAQPEITRELTPNRITEVLLEPKRGTYSFHDALSGAVGEIVVE